MGLAAVQHNDMSHPELPPVPRPQEPEKEIQPEFALSDKNAEITISEDRHVRDNQPVQRKTTLEDFFSLVSSPDPVRRTKDGPGYLGGPVNGLRRTGNLPNLHFGVLDADSSVGNNGEQVEGAPPPERVHEILKRKNITHCVYTTFSHGEKGNRYRLIVPAEIESQGQLKALMLWICKELAEEGLNAYLTKESLVWNTRWHYPRVPGVESPFYSAHHFGNQVVPSSLPITELERKGLAGIPEQLLANASSKSEHASLIGQFCSIFPLPELLSVNGYNFHGSGTIPGKNGEDIPTLRFKHHKRSGPPGVVVFKLNDKWVLYCHHANDDNIEQGEMLDSFGFFFKINNLMGTQNKLKRLSLATEMMQDFFLSDMERRNPVIMDAGTRFRVGMLVDSDFGGQTYRLLKIEDFRHRMANEPPIYDVFQTEEGEIKTGAKSRADWWRENTRRKNYDGTLFYPIPITDEVEIEQMIGRTRYFNTFRGWGIEPKEGPCSRILWHMENVLCSGNKEEFEYLLDWFSHLVQYPREKPNVAVVFRSGKGTGKSIITSAMAKAMGSLAIVFAHRRHLTGNFNAHLDGKLLAVFEEAFWAGSPEDEGPLKSLISEELLTVERKGVDAFQARSYLRNILITNNEWAAPASSDERRYFLPTVSEEGKRRQEQEGNYFSLLANELQGEGLQAFFWLVANRSIDKSAVRYPPQTEGLKQQKALSMSGLSSWFKDILTNGSVSDGHNSVVFAEYPKPSIVPMDILVESSEKYLGRGEKGRSRSHRVLSFFRIYFSELETSTAGGNLCLILPSLQEMRDKFNSHHGIDLKF